jgi:hypothetical protein
MKLWKERMKKIRSRRRTGFPEEKSDRTIEELKRLKPAMVSPMHCSGFKTLATVAREVPESDRNRAGYPVGPAGGKTGSHRCRDGFRLSSAGIVETGGT